MEKYSNALLKIPKKILFELVFFMNFRDFINFIQINKHTYKTFREHDSLYCRECFRIFFPEEIDLYW